MAVGLLFGALVVGGTLILASGGGKKKKKTPSTQDIAQTLAEKEAAGEIVVTDDGDVIPVETDPETEAIAQELADKEAAGEIVVTDDGDVAEKIGPNSWTLPENWFALFEVKPTGDSAALMQVLRSGVVSGDIYIIGGPTKSGNVKFASFDNEPSTFTAGEPLTPDIPATLVELQLLSKAEFDRLVMTDKSTPAVADPVAQELAEAEADGEIEVTESGDVIPTGGNIDQAAQALKDAEARGEVVVTDDGEVHPVTESDDEVAQELAAAEARGEIEVSESGEVAVVGPDPEAQELADLLVDAEREKGGLWKAAHKAEIQAWQIQQGVDFEGKPMKPDGWFGPKGALTVASLGVDAIPLVRGWPKGSNQQTAVTEYKIALQNLKTADPEAVRVALMRERGQGYGTARAIPPSEQVG